MAEALWVVEGTWMGLKALYPDRFDDEGRLLQTCENNAGNTLYGEEACADIISSWVAANSSPTAPCLGDACQDSIVCYAGNDASGTEYTSSDNCDLISA